MQETKKACQLAEAALQDAYIRIEDVDEETYRDAKSVLELLKDNLLRWSKEEGAPIDEDNLVWHTMDAPLIL